MDNHNLNDSEVGKKKFSKRMTLDLSFLFSFGGRKIVKESDNTTTNMVENPKMGLLKHDPLDSWHIKNETNVTNSTATTEDDAPPLLYHYPNHVAKKDKQGQSTVGNVTSTLILPSSFNGTSSITGSSHGSSSSSSSGGSSKLTPSIITTSTTSFDPFASIRSYQSSQSITDTSKMKRKKDVVKSGSSSSSNSPPIPTSSSSAIVMSSNSLDPLNITDPNAPLTLKELQQILASNGYIRREEMNHLLSDSVTTSINSSSSISSSAGSSTNINPMKPFFATEDKSIDTTQKKIKGVAMPQPTKVSNKHIRYGTMISSGVFMALIATTIQPNLWLIGSIIGALYGSDIANKAEVIANRMALEGGDSGSSSALVTAPRPGGLYGDVSLKLGQKIATWYLQVWDLLQTFWFLYRTGQLSYEYYQTYAKLDSKYGIQQKIDAWNSRFIEGKENFDRWEKENEVGRKLLAGMRTMWMVEESSYKKQLKGKKKSKYRIVRYADGAITWSKRFSRALWESISGSGNSELREIMKGMKLGLDELSLDILSQRIGAAVAALIVVSFIGAMFAVAPIFLGITSVVLAMVFPNWFGDTIKTVKDALEETRARGRGDRIKKPPVISKKEKLPFVEKNSFSYYIGLDGKKKWYRTGKSRFQRLSTDKDSNLPFEWPWLSK